MRNNITRALFLVMAIISLASTVTFLRLIKSTGPKTVINEFVLKPLDYRTYFFDLNQKLVQNLPSPASPRYSFLLLEEDLEPKVNPEIYMVFAIRRIYELQQWGNSLSVKTSINTIEDLNNWEKSDEFSYAFWESNYFTYMQRMDSYINKLISLYPTKDSRVLPMGRVYFHIILQKRDMESVIFSSQKTSQEKIHLKDLSDKMFDVLLKKIEKNASPFNTFPLYYNLSSIKAEPGESYQIILSQNASATDKKNAYFTYADKRINDNDTLVVSENNTLIQLHLPEQNLVKNKSWKKEAQQEAGVFPYSMEGGAFLSQTSYRLITHYTSNNIKILNVAEGNQLVGRDYLFPTEKDLRQQIFIDRTNNTASSSGTFMLFSQSDLTDTDLKKIKVELIPHANPEVILIKK